MRYRLPFSGCPASATPIGLTWECVIFVKVNERDMKPETRKIIIWSLENKINEYVRERSLFSGGCCYCAYILADIFTKLGIKYRTVLFQEYENADEHDFNNAINSGLCNHVAIEVNVGSKRVIIGDCSDITRYYEKWSVKHAIRRYRGITPEMLFEAYAWNDWNEIYDTDNNEFLKQDLYGIVNQFVPVAA